MYDTLCCVEASNVPSKAASSKTVKEHRRIGLDASAEQEEVAVRPNSAPSSSRA